MARILITSGPTREFLDPIRFISNQSSGRMGAALAQAALEAGHEVVLVSGPVQVTYPVKAKVIDVVTTIEMQHAVEQQFGDCDGIIAAAAPCDFRPVETRSGKMKKSGTGITIEFEETDDILGRISREKKSGQWSVGFALETEEGEQNARRKLKQKELNWIVLNGPEAMNSTQNQVRLFPMSGEPVSAAGSKAEVAKTIIEVVVP